MGLFDFFKKSAKADTNGAANQIYELLFCDNIELYKNNHQKPAGYPWNILFADKTDPSELKKMIADKNLESRVKILACNRLHQLGEKIDKKELLGVIVEVGFDGGLDVLAAFGDGTARYINQSGKTIIWETTTKESKELTSDLFEKSYRVVSKIGPWHEKRRPRPKAGVVRITFLVSDGLYFGEGPADAHFNDAMAGPALASAAELIKYLMDKASEK